MIAVIAGVIFSYLLGSTPFGYLAGKTLRGVDVRSHGSGSMGATNVLRTLGTLPGIIVLILDACKGVASVFVVAGLAYRFSPPLDLFALRALCGAAAIGGHDWPLFLRFRGGKGVATGLGVFLSVAPVHALVSLVPFLAAVILTRHVSVGSLVLALCFPVAMLITRKPPSYLALGLFWFVTVLYLHRQNIGRLLQGKESRIGERLQELSEEQ
jgi:glycerol-3-phosphate acyltransferase PlsY